MICAKDESSTPGLESPLSFAFNNSLTTLSDDDMSLGLIPFSS